MKTTAFETLVAPMSDHVGLIVKVADQTIFAHRARQLFPAASIIKLAILATLMDQEEDMAKPIRLASQGVVGGAGVLQELGSGTYSLRDVAALMISVSDNTAANLLIDYLGMATINDWLGRNGYHETGLNRRLMDVGALKQGRENTVSAAESERLLVHLLTRYPVVRSWFFNQQFRYKLPGVFDELDTAVKVANKTGEGPNIDHDVAWFETDSQVVTVAVLTAGIPGRQQALAFIQSIGQLIWQEMTQ
ncbi:serine hydrolase [Secundilactobacillus kimchicus]|uniref:Class A beta-lactamase n=1 Tax=Secundilactobacillus kimchicus JCM 15530 TaxID=1302272 RepID=A0A0R1HSW0_9LACO|nr:serine hydrolase [Secundilactobacillus kimchicus]KRK49516.1 class A beta-lactamase [Secundilactobacillus kimchicus JCM 15530]MBT9673060.1 serine hydrolase [Secundilactobacillus kimchicus]